MRNYRVSPLDKGKIYGDIISEIYLIEKTNTLIKNLNAASEGNTEIDFTRTYRGINQNLVRKVLMKMVEHGLSYTQFKDLYDKIFVYLEKAGQTVHVPTELSEQIHKLEQLLTEEI